MDGHPQSVHQIRSPSGKTSNGNLVLFQKIFDNLNDDTYFREIMSNLRSISEKKLYLHKEQQRYQCAMKI
jgi:hypothetical protein